MNFVIKTSSEEYYFVTEAWLRLKGDLLEIYDADDDREHTFPLADIESVNPTTLSLKEWMELGIS